MTPASVFWGSPGWLLPAALLAAAAVLILTWAYRRPATTPGVRIVAALLKTTGLVALLVCLVEPLFQGTRPRPGANLFVLLADNSQSLQIRDRRERRSRGEKMLEELRPGSTWEARLSQDFDVRRFTFDTRLQAVADFSDLTLDGPGSSLVTALKTIGRRYLDRPLAGVLLLTDGNATDLGDGALDLADLPPVYPVPIGSDSPARDLSLRRVTVNQTNFEAAPVGLRAEIESHGYAGKEIVTEVFDAEGKRLEQKTATAGEDGKPLILRFQLRPERSGVAFYKLRVAARSELGQFEPPHRSHEATLANNGRLAVVNRGSGPFRVLYVSGRPNWEFKFMRRALAEDKEVELVGLIRIAKQEPRFEFRGRVGESTNPLFRGFGNQDDEDAERYDQPVLVRIGTIDENELRDGFPKAADQLYRYHAIIVDDLEAGYFTQDQMSLVQKFVSHRGGGFLMLGGAESFGKGDYRRTPIGELLPLYLDRAPSTSRRSEYRLALTREGWLQPWIRLRATEDEEWRRLRSLPAFHTLNPVRGVKPGATVLAQVRDADGKELPALVAQRFGKGRVAALLIGDLWRWGLRRKSDQERDLEKAWRQTIRWLVADVPDRIDIQVRRERDDPSLPVALTVRSRDDRYEPLDNASVTVKVVSPDGEELELTADSSDREVGSYETTFVPRQPGAYRARVAVTAEDGSPVGEREAGWTSQGAADEFRALKCDRATLERIAADTGGEVVALDRLEQFVAGLPDRKIPITESWVYPLWHQWTVFLFALACLTAEWGLRRWRGLP